MSYTIGVDFGTDSVRALVVDARTGREMGTHVFEYPRWKEGKYCDPSANRFRQHPLDYLEGLENRLGMEGLKAFKREAFQQLAHIKTAQGIPQEFPVLFTLAKKP